ncbi:deleted in malignant brain tumors 1 protein-like isoform X2 [Pomacea canaliculata]|uniref:deleted in malignant brain tumors 1 protein-like isoform X2 n=1 Tax=Pomacea canaliculata TaxID=400727 RepID=UPI000D73B6C9|nr:deleted in malignant brain tumors 1 protein-like isoform X2 [Pomacea canaliculata]
MSLLECEHKPLYSHNCRQSNDVHFTSEEVSPLKARLADGDGKGGRLEILYKGEWRTVSSDDFGNKEARVACRMLGFASSGAVAVGSSVYGTGAGRERILLDEIKCNGTESSLFHCDFSIFYYKDGTYYADVGVICNEVSPLTARLANGDGKGGRLEILYNGEWSTVCDDGIRNKEARVACRMLGFNSSAVVAATSNAYGAGTGRIILDGVSCTGTEMSLLECEHKPLYSHNCRHSDGVGVICEDGTKPTTNTTITQVSPPTVRLADGDGKGGRLEIFRHGQWRTVCSYVFRHKEARVACRMLGFNSSVARAVGSSIYGEGEGRLFLDDIECNGTESSLSECEYLGFISHLCSHSNDVGVICKDDSPVAARLANGTEMGDV